MPAVFVIWRDQQLVDVLEPTGCHALLPPLLASIDALVQSVVSYYESYRRLFRQWQHGKKEKPEKAADRLHADNRTW
jgi:hypothetical protein